MKKFNPIKFVLAGALIFAVSNTFAETATSVWFCPNKSDILLPNKFSLKDWDGAENNISVYKFYYQSIMKDDVETLREKFNFLKKENIKVAVEWPALTWEEGGVGYKIEGFNKPGFSEEVARKIKAAGGRLDYIAIDEALFYGHYKKGPRLPQYDIATVANKVEDTLRGAWEIFPDMKVGDIEPIQQLPQDSYVEDLAAWIDAFKKSTGHSLDFLHNDVLWTADWATASKKVSDMLHQRGVRYGVIFNAGRDVKTNDEWIDAATANIDRYLSSSAPLPDDAIFQSWNRFPNKILAGSSTSASNGSMSKSSVTLIQSAISKNAEEAEKYSPVNSARSHVDLINLFCISKSRRCN